MNKKDRRILSKFAARLRQQYTEARIWAYGSRAKGTADWDSDFDICIVLDKVTPEKELFIRDIAWEIGFDNDRVITTFIIEQEEFEEVYETAAHTIVDVRKREGGGIVSIPLVDPFVDIRLQEKRLVISRFHEFDI